MNSGDDDLTPSEDVLNQFVHSEINDRKHIMLGLVDKVAAIGIRYRAELLSCDSIRKLVFDWVMGPNDHQNLDEQALARRMIDQQRFPPGVTYSSWIATQPKSSPKKRSNEDCTQK